MKRVNSIDSLRILFMGLIFISHLSFLKNGSFSDLFNNFFSQGGPAGVTFFILISGFFIGLKYSDKKNCMSFIDSIKFSSSRMSKFFKLHILTLILVLPLCVLQIKEILLFITKLIFNLSLLQTWVPSQSIYFSFNAVSWYLSLITFFYFIAPKALAFLSKLIKIVGGGR